MENGSQTYDSLIRQTATAAAMAQDHKTFLTEFRAQNLSSLLDETIKGQITMKRIRSACRDKTIARLRCDFIRKATDQGYEAPEIARALNKSDRYVRNIRQNIQMNELQE